MQPLDIPGHADEIPFAFGCLGASHLETPEPMTALMMPKTGSEVTLRKA